MYYLESKSTDPYFNLALEEFALTHLKEDCFMLWQNDNTIVIGNYQNPLEEISQSYVHEHNIKVVRRQSGGGAVYHDLGNLNFTFITEEHQDKVFAFQHFTQSILDVLSDYGVAAEFNSRNDLEVQGKKFSGNAQYIKNGRILHHGTILFASNLEVLTRALNVSQEKIDSKAIKSIRQRVANLKDFLPANVTLEVFKAALKNQVFGQGVQEPYQLMAEELQQVETLKREKYSNWEWNFGQSPKCNIVKRGKGLFGTMEMQLQVENGKIQYVQAFGDFFASEDFESKLELLVGCKYGLAEMKRMLSQINQELHGAPSGWLEELFL